jgi:hypothetical protein
VFCTAARTGSGLIGFEIALRDPGDTTTLQSEVEPATQDISWTQGGSMAPYTIPSTGTYLVRFTATGLKSGVTGAYYRCGLHLQ